MGYLAEQTDKTIVVDAIIDGAQDLKRQDRMVLVGARETLTVLAMLDCEITLVPRLSLLPVWLSIPLAKNSSLLQPLNDLIVDLMRAGVIDKWMQDYTTFIGRSVNSRCTNSLVDTGAGSQSLVLQKAQGAFWFLLFGFAIAGDRFDLFSCSIFSFVASD